MNKILVIEDEELVRANILMLLKFENFQAIGAENGYIGLQLAKQEVPDLIICDIMMPGLDGYSILNTLRQDPATTMIPFILLTAKADKADLRLGMTLGADDYLTKPFTQDELLEAIYARLDKQAVMNRQSQAKLDNLRSSIALSLPYQLLTPLNRIQRSAQMLCEEHNSIERPQILEIAQEIYTLSQVLHRLTQNFLFYALLEVTAADPGQVEALRRSKTHFSQRLITEVALAKAKQIARETDLQLELQEAALSILEANLAKIIEELLDNAFKFSQPGTPIQITSRLDQDKFMLCVIDQGCGMTSDQIANLGAYMQFEQKLSEQQESGAGLGLTIVKRLVELHGGRLVIHSIPCQQTTIRVVLPI